jgi:hypothetical protein
MQIVTARSALLRIGPRSIPILEPLLRVSPYVGVLAVLLHPTVASLYGARVGFIWGGLALALLLPACRRIILPVAISLLIPGLFVALYLKSSTVVLTVIAAYAMFYLVTFETRQFYRLFLIVCGIAAFVSLLQFLFPSEILNFHATAESETGFLHQSRPTSIFSAQVYYAQLLLLSLPIMLIADEQRGGVWALFGAAFALTGSTAGIFYTGLALLMAYKRRGYFTAIGFCTMLAAIAVFWPERFQYNYSAYDITQSTLVRIDPSRAIDTASPTHDFGPTVPRLSFRTVVPTLAIAVEIIAIAGLAFAIMVVARAKITFFRMLNFGCAAAAIVLGQVLHSTMGSLYFSLTFAVLVALQWKLITYLIPRTRFSAPPS